MNIIWNQLSNYFFLYYFITTEWKVYIKGDLNEVKT